MAIGLLEYQCQITSQFTAFRKGSRIGIKQQIFINFSIEKFRAILVGLRYKK